jgi:hypothetical protein
MEPLEHRLLFIIFYPSASTWRSNAQKHHPATSLLATSLVVPQNECRIIRSEKSMWIQE